jgi:hypothetical protein
MTAPGTTLKPIDGFFHQPTYREQTWLETNWFSFLVPEANLRAHLYNGFRTNLGVVFSAVCIWSGDCESVLDFDHYDAQVHLPMPNGNLNDYRLANGLHVAGDPLKRYTIEYEAFNGTRLELELTAMMPAVDSKETVVAGGSDFSHFHEVRSEFSSHNGHIDQTMQVEGQLFLDGRTIDISYPSNRDHSWSARPERNHGKGYFDEAYFDGMTFHVQTLVTDDDSTGSITNGYILDGDELLRILAGTARYERSGWYTTRLEYELEDDRGRTHRLSGTPTASAPLPTWPNQYNIAGLTRWELGDEIGWGEYKWHWEVGAMIRAREASGT